MSNIVFHDVVINGEVHSIPIDYDKLVHNIDFNKLNKHISIHNSEDNFNSIIEKLSELNFFIFFSFFVNLASLIFILVILFVK